MGTKREVPALFQTVLQWDIEITKKFLKLVENVVPLHKYKSTFKFLEVSCHGIPWIIGACLMIFLFNNQRLQNFAFNLLTALIIDIIVIACVKAAVRRRRPPSNNSGEMFATYSVDKFSFPSGHATRAIMLLFVLPSKTSLFYYLSPVLALWSSAICASRVLMRRHYLLDVSAGIVIGWLESVFIKKLFWMSVPFTNWFISFLLGD